MTSLIFSADLTTNPFGVTLNKKINSLDDFINIIQTNNEVQTNKIIDVEGQFHSFLVVVVDGEVVSNDDLVQCFSSPREIMLLNAIAGG